ncbi:MAG TPA: hypothetical protein VIK74_06030, partial [Parasegetibacter sp.]
ELKYEGLANEDDAPFYNWKIGLAILDIGKNQYQHSPNSLKFAGFHAGVEDEVLQRKFESITDIADLKDSLRTVANISTPGGIFGIRMPTRIVLNIDKHIHQHLYVHASLSANLNSVFNTEKFSTKELDMLTITPRWERERIGVFMPWQLNSQGQLWPGLAVKAGPFFFGLHKMSWIWNKKSMPNGGFYLGATFKKWNKRNKDEYSDCPRF